eukprot:scaffold7074_cov256-Pinguiococcus_pyrenoidosus.AAC.17
MLAAPRIPAGSATPSSWCAPRPQVSAYVLEVVDNAQLATRALPERRESAEQCRRASSLSALQEAPSCIFSRSSSLPALAAAR